MRDGLDHSPEQPTGDDLVLVTIDALVAVLDRLESPADRLLRTVSLRSNYMVLPVFALANAGVVMRASVLHGHGQLISAVALGLVVGKPLGMVAATALAVRLGLAGKPDPYPWTQWRGRACCRGSALRCHCSWPGRRLRRRPILPP